MRWFGGAVGRGIVFVDLRQVVVWRAKCDLLLMQRHCKADVIAEFPAYLILLVGGVGVNWELSGDLGEGLDLGLRIGQRPCEGVLVTWGMMRGMGRILSYLC